MAKLKYLVEIKKIILENIQTLLNEYQKQFVKMLQLLLLTVKLLHGMLKKIQFYHFKH